MTGRKPDGLNATHLRRRFDRAAEGFGSVDFLHRKTADGLLERMLPMSIQPRQILDLGSALGAGSNLLEKTFRKSRVLSVDLSAQMLLSAASAHRWFSGVREVQADAMQLPLATGSIDLVFANMLLPWIDDLPRCLAEVARVLRKDGVFLFSTLGADSLTSLRHAWGCVDDEPHVHSFADMHNLGDAIVHARLRDPVLDVDVTTVSYRSIGSLFDDLAAAGGRNSLSARRSTLTGKRRWSAFREQLQAACDKGGLQVKLELVYGHAWGGGAQLPPGEFRLSPSAIGRRAI